MTGLVLFRSSVDHRYVLPLDRTFREREVDGLQHTRGARFFVGQRACNAAHQCGIDGGRRALAAYIADGDAGHALSAVLDEVVKVAADLPRTRPCLADG